VKAVADTNVLVSGLLWKGPSASVLDQGALRLVQLVAREEILAELELFSPVRI
jgi:predicted nucleic acid-binding protein